MATADVGQREQTKASIIRAIGAHGMWKTRLRDAIETGRSDIKPEDAQRDDACEFGKWLRTTTDQAVKSSPRLAEVVRLHAEFHRHAGAILRLAVNGSRGEASKQLDAANGPFVTASSALTKQMQDWRDSI